MQKEIVKRSSESVENKNKEVIISKRSRFKFIEMNTCFVSQISFHVVTTVGLVSLEPLTSSCSCRHHKVVKTGFGHEMTSMDF